MDDYDPGVEQPDDPQLVKHLRYLLRQQRLNVVELERTLRLTDGQPQAPRIVAIYP